MSEWQQMDYVNVGGALLMLMLFVMNNHIAKKQIANLEEMIDILQRGIAWRDEALGLSITEEDWGGPVGKEEW